MSTASSGQPISVQPIPVAGAVPANVLASREALPSGTVADSTSPVPANTSANTSASAPSSIAAYSSSSEQKPSEIRGTLVWDGSKFILQPQQSELASSVSSGISSRSLEAIVTALFRSPSALPTNPLTAVLEQLVAGQKQNTVSLPVLQLTEQLAKSPEQLAKLLEALFKGAGGSATSVIDLSNFSALAELRSAAKGLASLASLNTSNTPSHLHPELAEWLRSEPASLPIYHTVAKLVNALATSSEIGLQAHGPAQSGFQQLLAALEKENFQQLGQSFSGQATTQAIEHPLGQGTSGNSAAVANEQTMLESGRSPHYLKLAAKATEILLPDQLEYQPQSSLEQRLGQFTSALAAALKAALNSGNTDTRGVGRLIQNELATLLQLSALQPLTSQESLPILSRMVELLQLNDQQLHESLSGLKLEGGASERQAHSTKTLATLLKSAIPTDSTKTELLDLSQINRNSLADYLKGAFNELAAQLPTESPQLNALQHPTPRLMNELPTLFNGSKELVQLMVRDNGGKDKQTSGSSDKAEQQITINANLPHLGSASVQIRIKAGKLTGTILLEDAAAVRLAERTSPLLATALERLGYNQVQLTAEQIKKAPVEHIPSPQAEPIKNSRAVA